MKEKNKVETENGVGCKMLESGDGGICVTSFKMMPPYLLLEDQHLINVNILERAGNKDLFCSFHIFMLLGYMNFRYKTRG